MILAAGAAVAAAGTALDLLSLLAPARTGGGKHAGVKQPGAIFGLSDSAAAKQSSSPPAGAAPGSALAPSTMNALLSVQDANQAAPSDPLKSLFTQIDSNTDGKITKAEFQDKLGAGGTNTLAADNVFNKIDTDGDGAISFNEMASKLKGRGHHAAPLPAANVSSQYNIVDQMVQRQTDALAASAKQSVSIKV